MRKIFLILAALSFASSANAVDIYKIDANHANITWSASHFGFSNPNGKFTDIDGVVTLDENNPQDSSVEITIKTSSLVTGLSKFDEHLKGTDFLNVAKYPTAKFVSTIVTPIGKTAAKIQGNLTLCGITKRVILDAKLNRIGLNPINQKKTVGFTASAVIKRSDFDIIFGLPGVSDNVKLAIEIEANLISSQSTEAGAWKIIPAKSKIEFTAAQDSSSVSGSFKKFDGKIIFDRDQLDKSKVTIEVDTTSVDSSFAEVVDALNGAAWLATKTFPKAIFTAEKFTALGAKDFRATGKLTLRNKTLPITLDFTLDQYSAINAHATGKTTIRRSAFGIGDHDPRKANDVKDEVIVTFDLSAEK